MPQTAAPADCFLDPARTAFPVPVHDRFVRRVAIAASGGGATREVGGWTRLAGGELMDDVALVAYADGWPLSVMARSADTLKAATVDLTVHFRRRIADAAGWSLVRFQTTLLHDGY